MFKKNITPRTNGDKNIVWIYSGDIDSLYINLYIPLVAKFNTYNTVKCITQLTTLYGTKNLLECLLIFDFTTYSLLAIIIY